MVTLWTQLFAQLKSGFEITNYLNKYQPKLSPEGPNQYLDFLIDPSFQGLNKHFVLLYENKDDRKVSAAYYLPEVEIKD